MGIIESLIAAIVALSAIAAGFFQAWRNAKRREKDAEAWAAAVTQTLEHAKRTQAAADKGQQATQEAADKARQAAREGRRDAFEGQ